MIEGIEEIDLLDCPFCTSDQISIYERIDTIMDGINPSNRTEYYGQCDDCGATGPIVTEQNQAADSWNRRELINL